MTSLTNSQLNAFPNKDYQPINAGSLNPFHNNHIQKCSSDVNPPLSNIPNIPKLPSLSSNILFTPTKKKRKRPKGIPKYNDSPTTKKRKQSQSINYENVTERHSKILSPLFNSFRKLHNENTKNTSDTITDNTNSQSMPVLHTHKNGYLTRSKRKKTQNNSLLSLSPSPSLSLLPIKKKKSPTKRKKKSPKKRKKKTQKKSKYKSRKNPKSKSYNNIKDHYSNINPKKSEPITKDKCTDWMRISTELDQKFDSSVRLDKNCITNYALHKKDIRMEWIKTGENVEKIIRSDNYVDYDMNDDLYNECVPLHRINLDTTVINLECPHCQIYVQCLSLSEDKIGFVCFNYPRCSYPLNDAQFGVKYVWDNVRYIGPMAHNLYLSSFGETKKNAYLSWQRQQMRLQKRLNKSVNWKQLQREKRHKLMTKRWKKSEKFRHSKRAKQCKISEFRQENMRRFEACLNGKTAYQITNVIEGEKVHLVQRKGGNVYRTRSRSRMCKTSTKKVSYSEISSTDMSESDSDNENNDPSYIPSPVPILDKNENKVFFEQKKKKNGLDLWTQKSENKSGITAMDKLTFLDLYNVSKSDDMQRLFAQLKESDRSTHRYDTLEFEAFKTCMTELLKANAERELIESIVLESVPNTGKRKGNAKGDLISAELAKQLPVFDFDLSAFANTFRLT